MTMVKELSTELKSCNTDDNFCFMRKRGGVQLVYGITVQLNSQRKRKITFTGRRKVFGVPLEKLPGCCFPEYGMVPCILLDACSFLLERAGTVGLFRQPGSSIRIKSLKAKLNAGEACLSTALPSDVASLIKYFCRELPEPLFPSEIHAALLQAQALPTREERTAATHLLSCLLPAPNISLLRYLFAFLSAISQRSAENLMTSSNLAVVFTPCLLAPIGTVEMSEGCLEVRVEVLRFFIENPHIFGVVPKAVMDGVEFLNFRPMQEATVPMEIEGETPTKGHCLKVSPPRTPATEQTGGKRPPLRRSLAMETFPNLVQFRKYTLNSEEQEDTEECRMPDEAPERPLNAGCFPPLTRGQSMDSRPVLRRVGKLTVTPWKRRRTL